MMIILSSFGLSAHVDINVNVKGPEFAMSRKGHGGLRANKK